MPLTNIDGRRLGDSVFDKTAARNLVVNGAAQVAQRATTQASVTSSGYYAVDRFKSSIGTLGTWTISQSTDSPDGFAFSYKALCTTADASPAAGDFAAMSYHIEGQDLQFLNFGNSGAKATTLSFYVKSNKAGNASVELQQRDNSDKQVTFQYTINSANTWERKVINVPGDTAGVINNDNGTGIRLLWWLNSGSDFTGGSFRSTWTAEADADRNVSNLGVGGATNDEFLITGLQWEVGNTATPFEHRSFNEEMSKCLRYYEKSYLYSVVPGTATDVGMTNLRKASTSTTITNFNLEFSQKRAAPTVTLYSTDDGAAGQIYDSSGATNRAASADDISERGCRLRLTSVLSGANNLEVQFEAEADLL
ncbi:MAG: hypothetical protein DWQ21_03635 [Bacteroidetes bacterium]|nr:MAG: hypothetical protein DWQ21_03635 [Bacteroidota bacterium]REK63900.1 MAG: hypothetical protein DWQ49_02040 [Bacteroidota bacterium]